MSTVSLSTIIVACTVPSLASAAADLQTVDLPVASNLERTTRPTALHDGEISINSGATDSGYASIITSPEKTPDGSEGEFNHEVVPLRKMFQRKPTKLKPFTQDISKAMLNRFDDLVELFDQPLYKHLAKTSTRFTAISIKLKVLGESEGTAKPWIVVMCDKGVSKKVKQFFNQQSVKSQYKPCSSDLDFPSFDIVFCDRPPREIAAKTFTKVYCINGLVDNRLTLCGILIKVGAGESIRYATLGGLIRVTTADNRYMLYGMTAGHVIGRDGDHLNNDAVEPSRANGSDKGVDRKRDEGEEEENELDDDTEDEFELEVLPKDDTASKTRSVSDTVETPEPSLKASRMWLEHGSVIVSSYETETEKNEDWALIDFGDLAMYRPNTRPGPDSSRVLVNLGRKGGSLEGEGARNVVVLSGVSGMKLGTLSISQSFLMQFPGKRFVKTLNLTLSDGTVLRSGDCGSWVVDITTDEVYGHVVATDVFGESYVIPLDDSLSQMKTQLSAKSVDLPSSLDIYSYISKKHNEQLQRPTDAPINEPNNTDALYTARLQPPMQPLPQQPLPQQPLPQQPLPQQPLPQQPLPQQPLPQQPLPQQPLPQQPLPQQPLPQQPLPQQPLPQQPLPQQPLPQQPLPQQPFDNESASPFPDLKARPNPNFRSAELSEAHGNTIGVARLIFSCFPCGSRPLAVHRQVPRGGQRQRGDEVDLEMRVPSKSTSYVMTESSVLKKEAREEYRPSAPTIDVVLTMPPVLLNKEREINTPSTPTSATIPARPSLPNNGDLGKPHKPAAPTLALIRYETPFSNNWALPHLKKIYGRLFAVKPQPVTTAATATAVSTTATATKANQATDVPSFASFHDSGYSSPLPSSLPSASSSPVYYSP